MAEIERRFSRPLCASLEGLLEPELGGAVSCVDRSDQHLRWDIEAVQPGTGATLRKVSHTRALHQPLIEAYAEVSHLSDAIRTRLTQASVDPLWLSYHIAHMPQGKQARLKLADVVTEAVVFGQQYLHQRSDVPRVNILHLLEDIRSRHFLHLACTFNLLEVRRNPVPEPAILTSNHDRRMAWRLEPMSQVVLPRLEEEIGQQHRIASDLTLVIEVVDDPLLPAGFDEVRAALRPQHFAYRSFYLVQRCDWQYLGARIY